MFAITGAGGQLGRHIAAELIGRTDPQAIRLGSRNPDRLASFAQRGAETVAADFDDTGSLSRLFRGCRTVLVISGDAPPAPRLKQHEAAFAAATKAGVERVIYTSFTNAGPASLFSLAASHGETEGLLRSSGMDFTILRNNHYAENIMVEAARQTGELAQPGSRGKIAYITYSDIAAATAGAMLGDGHTGRTYEITGPEALDHYEVAEELGSAWNREIIVRELNYEEYERNLGERGLPPFIVELVSSLSKAAQAGEYSGKSTDASDLAGRQVKSARHFLRYS